MERVKDIATVAHNWANGIGESARASNLFFEERNIYSYGYHFLIAKHVYSANGGHAVLITQKTYSKSTTAQVNLVRQASRHIPQLFVPNPEWPAEELFDKWYSRIKAIAGGLDNARKPEKCILDIQAIYAEAKKYADFFGYEVPEVLAEAGLLRQYESVMTQAHEAFLNVSRAGLAENAAYVLPLGTRTRALFKMDFAEALYIAELRSTPAGHFSYRRIAWEMYQAVARKHPALAQYFRVADINEPVNLLQR